MRGVVSYVAAVVVVLAVIAAAGCGSEEEKTPLTLEQRLVQPSDFPEGFEPDGSPTTTNDVDVFVESVKDSFVQATPAEVREALVDDGFIAAANGGLMNDSREAEAGSAAIQFASEDGAKDALEFRYHDALLPCRERCDIEISKFDVSDISDAKGVQRSKTEESSARTGMGGPLFDSYEVSFADGSFLYVVRAAGPPGAVTKDEVIDAAKALYERVNGVPLPSG